MKRALPEAERERFGAAGQSRSWPAGGENRGPFAWVCLPPPTDTGLGPGEGRFQWAGAVILGGNFTRFASTPWPGQWGERRAREKKGPGRAARWGA